MFQLKAKILRDFKQLSSFHNTKHIFKRSSTKLGDILPITMFFLTKKSTILLIGID